MDWVVLEGFLIEYGLYVGAWLNTHTHSHTYTAGRVSNAFCIDKFIFVQQRKSTVETRARITRRKIKV